MAGDEVEPGARLSALRARGAAHDEQAGVDGEAGDPRVDDAGRGGEESGRGHVGHGHESRPHRSGRGVDRHASHLLSVGRKSGRDSGQRRWQGILVEIYDITYKAAYLIILDYFTIPI